MKVNVYSIMDTVSASFSQPHCAVNDATAVRGVSDLITRDENIRNHVSDYTLYRIGEYDDSLGQITGLPQPEMVVRLATLVKT